MTGSWPGPLRRFLLNFLPAKRAPRNDGATAPDFEESDWMAEVVDREEALELARRANDLSALAAKTSEEKASRLVRTTLALVTISIGLAGIQLDFTLGKSTAWLISLVPVACSTAFLTIAAFEALQVDRVGFYQHAALADLATETDMNALLKVLRSEEYGRQLASWTARKKHTDLMQARAWFTRGLVALVAAGLLAAVLVGLDIGSAPLSAIV